MQNWSDTTSERLKKHVAVYKRIRRYLCEDYYQILPPPRSLEDNEGWEFIDPVTQEGFIQLFRTEGSCGRIKVKFRGIQLEGSYLLCDPYTGQEQEYTGKKLTDGLEFNLEPFSSLVRIFKKSKIGRCFN